MLDGAYILGRRYPKFQTKETGGRISYDGTWTIYVNLPQMTETEEDAIHNGELQISFAVVQDKLFILAKFGEMPLADMPFEPALYENPQEFADCEEGEGIAVLVLGIDTYDGQLKVIRLLSLSTEMSNALHKVCRELDGKHRPLNRTEHLKDLEKIYQSYPQPNDLLALVKPEHTMVFPGGR